MEKPTCYSAILVLVLVFALTAFLATGGAVYANVLSNFDDVVRIQGSNTSTGGTGSLIGMVEYGSTLRMVFIGADHTLERVGPIKTIGFGNLGSPTVNLDASGASIYTMGPSGTEDLAIYGITVDLNALTPSQKSFLTGLTPISVAASPSSSSLPFGITDYGYGTSDVSSSYGTQNSFTNQITGYQSFSGTYTTDKNGNPLYYTEMREKWIYDPTNNKGAGVSGFSGSPLIFNGAIQGIQVSGNISAIGAENWGLSFTDADVAWINAQRDALLVPIPGAVWLFGSGLLGLMGWRKFRKG
jgi:hypothetical protein